MHGLKIPEISGELGSGKTTLAAVIANALSDSGYECRLEQEPAGFPFEKTRDFGQRAEVPQRVQRAYFCKAERMTMNWPFAFRERLRYGQWLADHSGLYPRGSTELQMAAIRAIPERHERPRKRYRPRVEHKHLNREERGD